MLSFPSNFKDVEIDRIDHKAEEKGALVWETHCSVALRICSCILGILVPPPNSTTCSISGFEIPAEFIASKNGALIGGTIVSCNVQ